MFKRPGIWLPASTISLFVLIVVLGCGGSGGGGSATGGGTTTASSTSSSSTTSSGGTAGTMSLAPSGASGQITAQAPRVGIKLNYNGPAGMTFVWTVAQPETSPTGGLFFNSPGIEGVLQTVSGQPFPQGPTSLTQAVYVGDPTEFAAGNYDQIQVQAFQGQNPFNLFATMDIPLGSDFVTLPNAITSPVAGMTTDHPTYKPGTTITATITTQPGINNTQMVIDAPIGFTPSGVTINGNAATLPATFKYGSSGGAISFTVTFGIPASTPSQFPVSSTLFGQTGPWLVVGGIGGSGPWAIYTPFFIHT